MQTGTEQAQEDLNFLPLVVTNFSALGKTEAPSARVQLQCPDLRAGKTHFVLKLSTKAADIFAPTTTPAPTNLEGKEKIDLTFGQRNYLSSV